jgi:hypothetical protein
MIKILKDWDIRLRMHEKEMAFIPKEGPFIILVNRFSQHCEEAVLIEILKEVRPDIRVLSFNRNTKDNEHAVYIKDYARPWPKVREDYIKEIKRANKMDYPIVIFPGRRISKIDFEKFGWDKEIMKTVYLSRIPVVPMYCNWDMKLRSPLGFLIPEIYFEKITNKDLVLRVGRPLLPEQLQFIDSVEMFRKYMYVKTFSLGKSLQVDSFFNKTKIDQDDIMPEISAELIEKDISSLPEEALICVKGKLRTYFAASTQLPNALAQIGLLRERTFREAEEGTGKGTDIDEFDVFYYQLIVWDEKEKRIAGGCRIAFADWVIQYYGKKGLYTNSLFQYDAKMTKVLQHSIEMGRLFIVKQYQKSPNALLIIWKSLFEIVSQRPNYKYFIGTVSISREYSDYSKKLIIHYLKKYCYNENLADHVTSRSPFVYRIAKEDKEALFDINANDDLQVFNGLIEDLEPKHLKISVMIRQYIKLHAKFIGFAVDKNFSNTLDGLVIMKMDELNEAAKQLLER